MKKKLDLYEIFERIWWVILIVISVIYAIAMYLPAIAGIFVILLYLLPLIVGNYLLYRFINEKEALLEKKKLIEKSAVIPYGIQLFIQANGYLPKQTFFDWCGKSSIFENVRSETYSVMEKTSSFAEYASDCYEEAVSEYYKNAFCRKALSYSQFDIQNIYAELKEFHSFFESESYDAIAGTQYNVSTIDISIATDKAIDKMQSKGWIKPHNEDESKHVVYDVIISPEPVLAELKKPVYQNNVISLHDSFIFKIKTVPLLFLAFGLACIFLVLSVAIFPEKKINIPVKQTEIVQTQNQTENEYAETEKMISSQENVTIQEQKTITSQDYNQLSYMVLSERADQLSPLDVKYYFSDITGDEIPELIIAYGEINPTDNQEIYVYSDGDYQIAGNTFGEEFYFIPDKKQIISCAKAYGEGCLTKYCIYEMDANNKYSLIDYYDYYDGNGNSSQVYYLHNEMPIAENAFIQDLSAYLEGALYPIYADY